MQSATASPARSERLAPAALALLSDERLARLAAAGDRAAFAAIYERYHQRLYRYCLSILADPEDARDALQSTMANTLQAMADRGPPIALKPWVYRIAHNESVSTLRRRRPHDEISAAEAAAASPQDDGRERLAQVLEDLRGLPEAQRGVLVMRELGGLSFADIAAAHGTSPAAVRQTLHEARKALQDCVAGRDTACAEIQRRLSERDHRVVRGRKLRAHLRSCAACREFRDAVSARRAELRALVPPLPAATGAAMLKSILGEASGGGGSGGLVAAIGSGAQRVLRVSGVAKPAAVATVAISVGAGIVDVATRVEAAGGAAPSAGAAAGSEHHRGSARERTSDGRAGAEPHPSQGAAPKSIGGRGPAEEAIAPEERGEGSAVGGSTITKPSNEAGSGRGAPGGWRQAAERITELVERMRAAVGGHRDAAAGRLKEPLPSAELPAAPGGDQLPTSPVPIPPRPDLAELRGP